MPSPGPLKAGLAAALGLAVGLAALENGLYDVSAWGPLALAVLAVALGLVVARPVAPRGPALAALAGLACLWALSLTSMLWAESSAQALTEANRWALYAALMAVLLLALGDERLRALVLGTAALAVLGVAAYVLATMLGGDGSELFFEDRLNDPVGYINAQAGYLSLAFWPLVALAEQRRSRPLAAAAIGCAVALVGVILLSQTRGAVFALLASAAVLLVMVPGRMRRAWVLVAVLAGALLLSGPVLDVYDGGVTEASLRDAARWTLAAAVVAALAWLAGDGAATRIAGRWGPGHDGPRRISAFALVATLVLGLGALVVAAGNPVTRLADEVEAFAELRGPAADNRLFSGGGHRKDYWRIAIDQFGDHPLGGVGAGNFDRTYYLERRNTDNVRQPHSLALQELAELGLPGGAALGAFVAGLLVALRRRARAARERPGERMLTVAAAGVFLTWLVHTSTDWLHVLPGVTAIALCAAAALLGPWASQTSRPVAVESAPTVRRRRGGAGWRTVAVVLAFAVPIATAAAFVGRETLAESYRSSGARALAVDPRSALQHARKARRLNGASLPVLYLESAAYARLGRYPEARRALLRGARLEPHDFVPWALLGDLAVRRGDLEGAARQYRRAARLNPRDELIARLARDPAHARIWL